MNASTLVICGDETDPRRELLPAYAEQIRHSNVPAGVYEMAWRARGLGDCRVVMRQALQDGGE